MPTGLIIAVGAVLVLTTLAACIFLLHRADVPEAEPQSRTAGPDHNGDSLRPTSQR